MKGKKNKVKKEIERTPEHVNCLWGLICSMSAIDQQNNNISLFNVISQLNIPKSRFKTGNEFLFPFQHELIIVFRRAIESKLCTDILAVDTKVALIDPSGKLLNELLIPIKFEVGKRIVRFRFQIPNLKLSSAGDYVYRIEVKQPLADDMRVMNEIPFEVIEVSD